MKYEILAEGPGVDRGKKNLKKKLNIFLEFKNKKISIFLA